MNLTLPVSGAWRTTAIDLGQWLPGGSADGRNRRVVVVATRSGEGPFTHRLQTSILARRPRASWMEARITKLAEVLRRAYFKIRRGARAGLSD